MTALLHNLLIDTAERTPAATALRHKKETVSYETLAQDIHSAAAGLIHLGLERNERVGIYLPKSFSTVTAFFAATCAGGVFVPINPVLKSPQVQHILQDCNIRVLITSADRLKLLSSALAHCHDLNTVVLLESTIPELEDKPHYRIVCWDEFRDASTSTTPINRIDRDMAGIFYTSGSTGKPKGVVLSHLNMVAGAHSVARYLENTANDRLLAVLPFSFDYGFSQLSTAFSVGASVTLLDYLLPRDVVKVVQKDQITGLAAVPPLWIKLSELDWPEETSEHLRYITNSGGAMPQATLAELRKQLPKTRPYLMYGLTEAFRSTYLPPEEIDKRPGSMGKAIPNAEVMVVRADGTECAPGEPGELVHRGSLVSMGYWNDPEKTAIRFKPAPNSESGIQLTEMAVWSGDTVKKDEDGFLYFVGRTDEMIKTSGYRVSPTEIEEEIYKTGLVSEVIALGIPHPELGQAIVLIVVPLEDSSFDENELTTHCKKNLPNFMV
ncbi:MAG: acyl-CoA ligase (AMP-forming), exosortase A system-associated, partial [Gammaproteobacteria bacterium]|nr:acyl-CoA ligase (AMP-forming), exosortase A system-associated [Gammaproteobacteria bacterium]